MHEMSVALEVCRMTEGAVGREQLPNVRTVGLDVGCEAGLEFDNLTFCLDALLTSPPFREARSAITRLPGDVLRLTYLEVDDGDPDH